MGRGPRMAEVNLCAAMRITGWRGHGFGRPGGFRAREHRAKRRSVSRSDSRPLNVDSRPVEFELPGPSRPTRRLRCFSADRPTPHSRASPRRATPTGNNTLTAQRPHGCRAAGPTPARATSPQSFDSRDTSFTRVVAILRRGVGPFDLSIVSAQ